MQALAKVNMTLGPLLVTQINEVEIEQDKRAMDASSRPRVSCLVKYIIMGTT